MKKLVLKYSDGSTEEKSIPESFEELTFEIYLKALNAPKDWFDQVHALTDIPIDLLHSLDLNSSIILRRTIAPLFIRENLLKFDSPVFAGVPEIEIENESWNKIEIAKKIVSKYVENEKDILNAFPEILQTYRPELTIEKTLSEPVSKWFGFANFFLSGLIGSWIVIQNLTTNQTTPTS